jgi:uncharacterized protein YbjT (DUF2867 family)
VKPILVTGATGNVGLEIVRQLIAAGHPVRAAVTSVDSGRATLEQAVGASDRLEIAYLEFGNDASYSSVFSGCEACFLMRPPAVSDTKRWMLPAIDAGVMAGVKRWVFLSLQGAERNPVVPHAAVEKHLEQLAGQGWVTYTFLRAAFFMQNLSGTHRDDIRQKHDLFIPAGNGKTAFIDVRDIAAVGVEALSATNENLERLGLRNAGVELTGDEALTYHEVADIMTRVLHTPITYSNPSNLAFGWHLARKRVPFPQILVMEALYTIAKLGLAGRLTGEVKRILGREPITLEQFVNDYAPAWLS